jgi:hypothetical protein
MLGSARDKRLADSRLRIDSLPGWSAPHSLRLIDCELVILLD